MLPDFLSKAISKSSGLTYALTKKYFKFILYYEHYRLALDFLLILLLFKQVLILENMAAKKTLFSILALVVAK